MRTKYSIEERKRRRINYMKNYHLKRKETNRKARQEYDKMRYIRDKEKIDKRNNEWMKKNKHKFRKYLDKYYSNPEKILRRKEISRKWYKNKNKIEYRKHKRKWENNKRDNDIQFRLKKNLRVRIIQAFNKFSSTGKIRVSKDYDINYDKIIKKLMNELPVNPDDKDYHIDHIIPCCSFDLTDPEQVKECFAPENHQWLLAKDNLSKVSEDLKQSLRLKNKQIK